MMMPGKQAIETVSECWVVQSDCRFMTVWEKNVTDASITKTQKMQVWGLLFLSRERERALFVLNVTWCLLMKIFTVVDKFFAAGCQSVVYISYIRLQFSHKCWRLDLTGLDVYINRTERLYTTLEVNGQPVIMSRADFWALAGIEAVYYSNELATSCRGCVQHPPNIT